MYLEVSDLHIRYGRTHALKGIDLEVREGEVVAVVGANGAGKSTLLKSIHGLVAPSSGHLRFNGRSLDGLRVDERMAQGIVLVPEGRQILVSLTVHENLQLGAYHRADKMQVEREISDLYARFENLAARRNMLASCLSGGEQQMLAISRALLAKPKLLMMDEPSLGLSPLLVQRVFALIRELNRDGLSILLIEQNTNMALQEAHRAYLLELGRVVASGPAAQLRDDDVLRRAYLGSDS